MNIVIGCGVLVHEVRRLAGGYYTWCDVSLEFRAYTETKAAADCKGCLRAKAGRYGYAEKKAQ